MLFQLICEQSQRFLYRSILYRPSTPKRYCLVFVEFKIVRMSKQMTKAEEISEH